MYILFPLSSDGGRGGGCKTKLYTLIDIWSVYDGRNVEMQRADIDASDALIYFVAREKCMESYTSPSKVEKCEERERERIFLVQACGGVEKETGINKHAAIDL